VKIRGFRVEPAEIEAVLGSCPKIRDCIVTVHISSSAGKRLVAYFVPEAGQNVSADELRHFLQQKLPEYMMPSFFVPLPELPLNANGKVNRAALPVPEIGTAAADAAAAPRDAIETQLVEVWQRVLGVTPIGIRSNFFELGGHSMLAVQLVAQIERTFGKKLSVASLFQAPTVEQLARVLRGPERNGNISSIVEIQPKGSRPPLFLVHGVGGGMFWGYTNLSRHIGTDQPIYALKSRAMDGAPEFATMEEMAAHYLVDIRKVQPHGPYYLGGYCFSGNVAYEVAQQLKAAGEDVAFLSLINCGPPNSGYGKIQWTASFAIKFLKNLGYWVKHTFEWTPAQRREFVDWKFRSHTKRAERLLGRKDHQSHVDVDMLVDLSS